MSRSARIAAILLAIVFSVTMQPAVGAAADGRYRVCLDPGHGGSDPGAVRGALLEKDLNLDIARRIRDRLGSISYNVHLTRDGDTTLGNTARAEICNAFNAQIVVSIHLNASTDASVDYVWFFYGKRSKDAAFTRSMDRSYVISHPSGVGTLPHKAITNFANGTLLKSRAPATLAEALFMSHTDEQRLLADPSGARLQEIADALTKGIRDWTGVP